MFSGEKVNFIAGFSLQNSHHFVFPAKSDAMASKVTWHFALLTLVHLKSFVVVGGNPHFNHQTADESVVHRVYSRRQAGSEKFHHEGTPHNVASARHVGRVEFLRVEVTGDVVPALGSGYSRGIQHHMTHRKVTRETPLFQIPDHVRGVNEHVIVAFVNPHDVTTLPGDPLKEEQVLQRQISQLVLEIPLDDVVVVFSLFQNSLVIATTQQKEKPRFNVQTTFRPFFAPPSRSYQGPSLFELASWPYRQQKKNF